MIIDIHSHIVTPEYYRYIEKNGGLLEDSMRIPSWRTDAALEFMDTAGISWSLLSVSSPHPVYRNDIREGIAVCRQINETCAALVKKYPARFRFQAILPLPDVDAAILEAQYALDRLGASGIKLASNARGQYLGDAALEPLFSMLNKRNAVITIHPHRPEPLSETIFSAKSIPLFEFLCDTTRAVLNLIANGVTTRYPNLKFIVPHCGSFLPNIADRAEGFLPLMHRLGLMEQQIHVKQALAGLYYDTAGTPVPDLLPLLLKIAPADHILYGSDYPFTPAPICEAGLHQLRDFFAGNPQYGRYGASIFCENARQLFPNIQNSDTPASRSAP